MRRTRVAAGVAVVVAVVGVWGSAALAHVTVQPEQAEAGGFATIAFQVPNERPNVSTTKVKVQFPPDHPLAFVSVKPKAGWTYTVEKAAPATPLKSDEGETVDEVVSTITWEGGEIKPGEFDDFPVSVGQLPEGVESLSFPAIQTYSDGTTVDWIDKEGADGKEPEHPAPTLTLVAGSGDDHHGSTDDTSATNGTKAPTVSAVAASDGHSESAASTSTTSSSSNGLAIAALVVGGLALVIGIAALVVGRGRGAST